MSKALQQCAFGFLAGLAVLLCCQPLWASKAYITDSFRISLRRGPGPDQEIIKFLPSGTIVDVQNTEGEWSLVRLPDPEGQEIEGWVLERYLTTELPWEARFTMLRQERDRQDQRIGELEKALEQASMRENALSTEMREHIRSHEVLREQYARLRRDAADYLHLKAAHEDAQRALGRLNSENEALRSSQMNRWFATGALVLLCGLLVGLLIGRQQKKRSSLYY
ncbi:MAG: TIGR04211 family SH3 domain-containing protein [Deltaproteobacteria bacterium]|nr:TIGR04211 family SH3 domain-containing protein [Deltaproteobacteria bacterium]